MTDTLHRTVEGGREAGPVDRLLGDVGTVMTREVVTLEADMPADRAVRELARREVAGGPVLDRGKVIGMVTLRGMLRWAAPPWAVTGPFLRHEHELASLRVRELMRPGTPVARPDWPVARAAGVMYEAGVTSLPVVDDGAVVGIVARDDVIRAIAQARQPGIVRVQDPDQVPDERHPGRSQLTPD
jgi:acetoin utilization protein AcuB